MNRPDWDWACDLEKRRQLEEELRSSGIMDEEFIAWVCSMEEAYRSDPEFRQMVNGEIIE
jgi:hypothetical protein